MKVGVVFPQTDFGPFEPGRYVIFTRRLKRWDIHIWWRMITSWAPTRPGREVGGVHTPTNRPSWSHWSSLVMQPRLPRN